MEKCNFQNFRGHLTLTLDQVTQHTVVHQSWTSIYIPNVTEIGKTFCGQTDIPNDGRIFPPVMLLDRLAGVDLIKRQ